MSHSQETQNIWIIFIQFRTNERRWTNVVWMIYKYFVFTGLPRAGRVVSLSPPLFSPGSTSTSSCSNHCWFTQGLFTIWPISSSLIISQLCQIVLSYHTGWRWCDRLEMWLADAWLMLFVAKVEDMLPYSLYNWRPWSRLTLYHRVVSDQFINVFLPI